MAGCILKVYGPRFDVLDYLSRVSIKPVTVFEVGKPITSPHGGPSRRVANESGFHCVASEKAELDLKGQVEDAIAFLRAHLSELELLSSYPIREAYLDFAVGLHKGGGLQRESLPVELLSKASIAKLEIVLSLFPVGEETEENT